MVILPAIDILDGKVVRLFQGDFNRVTSYQMTPVTIAEYFKKLGYNCLHVIDLKGAKVGAPQILSEVGALLKLGVQIQVGGGIRTLECAKSYFSMGVKRIIVSTQVLIDSIFIEDLLRNFSSDNVMVSLDVKEGKLAIKGWLEEEKQNLSSILEKLIKQNVKNVIVTDIVRDGTLLGINIPFYQELLSSFPSVNFYAAGGISSHYDIEQLQKIGMFGAIVGKAFYTKNHNLL